MGNEGGSEQGRVKRLVKGVGLDEQTRCVHYGSAVDIVAIMMKCCGVFYACKDCHEELAGHAIETWRRAEWGEKAILCGACNGLMAIDEYLECEARCPACGAAFNPKCRNHHHFYFAGDFKQAG